MARMTSRQKRARVTTPKQPRSRALPGLEDRNIQPLEDVASEYAELRDQRMQLTQREAELKTLALSLMKKYGKTVYRHDGIEIVVVPGEEGIKVHVKKEPLTVSLSDADERRAVLEGE